MIVTQKQLISQIAKKEGVSAATVRRIIEATEDVVFDCLSSTTPSESVVVKILNGISVVGKYTPTKDIHTYEDIHCEERIKVRAKVTRHYSRRINGYYDK